MRATSVPFELYIRNIYHYIRYSAEERTASFDITSRQGRLLEIIADGIQAGKEINRKYLEETMLIKGSSVTSLLNALEKKDFIKRETSEDDGRALRITMTAKGESAISQVKLLFEEQEDKLLNNMTEEEIQMLQKLLKKACDNINVSIS